MKKEYLNDVIQAIKAVMPGKLVDGFLSTWCVPTGGSLPNTTTNGSTPLLLARFFGLFPVQFLEHLDNMTLATAASYQQSICNIWTKKK